MNTEHVREEPDENGCICPQDFTRPDCPVCPAEPPRCTRRIGRGTCAYCTAITTIYWTGRSHICRQCFIDNMGEAPPEPPVGASGQSTGSVG